jgi:CHAD domain-containing protein
VRRHPRSRLPEAAANGARQAGAQAIPRPVLSLCRGGPARPPTLNPHSCQALSANSAAPDNQFLKVLSIAHIRAPRCCMASLDKWIGRSVPTEPLSQAAAAALHNRLASVWHWLPRAAKRYQEDVEYVHQLRVSSRRAVAALLTLSELLPKQKREGFIRRLKRVRRAAGDARDCDVLLQRFQRHSQVESASILLLVEHLQRLRANAQPAIVSVYDELRDWDYSARVDDLVRKLAWRDTSRLQPDLQTHARRALEPALAGFFEAAAQDLTQVERLHELRIAGKKLRYTLELFAGGLPRRPAAALYAAVELLQERLGKINDRAVAAGSFAAWRDRAADARSAGAFEAFYHRERRWLARYHNLFLKWWTPARRAELWQLAQDCGLSPDGVSGRAT